MAYTKIKAIITVRIKFSNFVFGIKNTPSAIMTALFVITEGVYVSNCIQI